MALEELDKDIVLRLIYERQQLLRIPKFIRRIFGIIFWEELMIEDKFIYATQPTKEMTAASQTLITKDTDT